jgi:hypothetical protein
MNSPIIESYLALSQTPDRDLAKFEKYTIELEQGITNKHIWNTDVNDAKYYLSRLCDEVLKKASEPWVTAWHATRGEHNWPRGWSDTDPREYVIYHPQFSNTPGAAKRLGKFYGQDANMDKFIDAIREVAKVAEMFKTVKPFIEKGRKPNPNAKEKDLTNTGICAICFARQKLTISGTLVAHGFILRWGSRDGICYGMGHKAWELSPAGSRELPKRLFSNRI